MSSAEPETVFLADGAGEAARNAQIQRHRRGLNRIVGLRLAVVNSIPRTNGRVVYIIEVSGLRGFIAQRPVE